MEVSSRAILNSIPSYYNSPNPKTKTQIRNLISSNTHLFFKGENRFPSFKESSKFQGIVKNRNFGDNFGFEDKGHLEYYYMVSPVCGGDKKEKGKKKWNGVSSKKKMKLLKGLVENLSEFSELGFGLDLGCCDEGLVADDKTKMISAAEVLLAQLKQLRAEEEKLKKMEKLEKQKSKKQDCKSSSSSSESSSDSECDEVVDMTRFRNEAVIQKAETMATQLGNKQSSLPTESSHPSNSEQGCCNMILEATINESATIEVLNTETRIPSQFSVRSVGSSVIVPPQGKKIEVCMGGKCKKSGAPALMEEFQRVVGDEAAVVGCKCMGKCKSAPNVRVVNGENVDDGFLSTPSNPLCVGVGLEDVGLIVANYFGEEKKGLGLAVAAVPS